MLSKYYLSITLFAGVLSGFGGWTLHSLVVDSRTLAAERAAAVAMQYAMDFEFQTAVAVENKLQELRANERVIHTREREVVDRPVYRNICIDDDGLRIIEAYATQNTAGVSGSEVP